MGHCTLCKKVYNTNDLEETIIEDRRYLVCDECNQNKTLKIGKVKWFSYNKNYGFITDKEGKDYYLSIDNIKDKETLMNEDIVFFKPTKTDKGLKAEEVKIINYKDDLTEDEQRISDYVVEANKTNSYIELVGSWAGVGVIVSLILTLALGEIGLFFFFISLVVLISSAFIGGFVELISAPKRIEAYYKGLTSGDRPINSKYNPYTGKRNRNKRR